MVEDFPRQIRKFSREAAFLALSPLQAGPRQPYCRMAREIDAVWHCHLVPTKLLSSPSDLFRFSVDYFPSLYYTESRWRGRLSNENEED